jgi:two-component system chemotaxis response regulator CheY
MASHEDVVLIVDDDESIREALEMGLSLEHHASAVAADGREALSWLHAHGTPRLILLDLMMPVMDGWQVLDQLRKDERLARVPVVVITAFGRDLGSAAQFPVLRKPIELQPLLDLVRSYGPAH